MVSSTPGRTLQVQAEAIDAWASALILTGEAFQAVPIFRLCFTFTSFMCLLSTLASLALAIASFYSASVTNEAEINRQRLQPQACESVDEMPSRHFRFPLLIDSYNSSRIKEVRMFVSEDRGKTWKKAAVATPDQDHIDYSVRRDGLYWFTLQIVDHEGRLEPRSLKHFLPQRKVRVKGEDNHHRAD